MPNMLGYHRQARILGATPSYVNEIVGRNSPVRARRSLRYLRVHFRTLQTLVRQGINLESMKILVVGGGAREHALAWKLARERGVIEVICAPGNPGIAAHARCVPADVANPRALLAIAIRERIDLTVVGPELPLSLGVVDVFAAAGRAIVGPTRAAAALEWSKAFAKDFMARHRVPTARFRVCDSATAALEAIASGEFGYPLVLKADGLAAGKGVVIAEDRATAEDDGARDDGRSPVRRRRRAHRARRVSGR